MYVCVGKVENTKLNSHVFAEFTFGQRKLFFVVKT